MTKRTTVQHSKEFKQSSAKLAAGSDVPVVQTAKDLGVNPNTLHGWIQKYAPKVRSTATATATNNLEQENKQLRKENARLKQERDILKKATAYFAREIQ